MVAPCKSVMFNLRTNYWICWEGSRKMTENLNISNVIRELPDKKTACRFAYVLRMFHLLVTIYYRPVNKLNNSNYLFRRWENIFYSKITDLIPLHHGIRISKMLWSSIMDRRQYILLFKWLVCTHTNVYAYLRAYVCCSQWTGVYNASDFYTGRAVCCLQVCVFFFTVLRRFLCIEVGLIRLFPNSHLLFIRDRVISFGNA